MVLPDINVLVYAHRAEMPDHRQYVGWLTDRANSDEAFGMSDLVLAGFLRLVTNQRIFDPPSPMDNALRFVSEIRSFPSYLEVGPGPRHWDIFTRLCVAAGGVLTGEHGVGVEKRDLMPEMFNETDLAHQQRVKCAFDDRSLLNPGKVFPVLHRCAELGRMHIHGGKMPFPDIPRF